MISTMRQHHKFHPLGSARHDTDETGLLQLWCQWMILFMLVFLTCAASPKVYDHTSVDLWTNIPSWKVEIIKTLWLNVPGESHSAAYRNGLSYVQTYVNTNMVAVLWEQADGTAMCAYTNGIRVSRATKGDVSRTTWRYSYGEEDWFTSATAITTTKNHISWCYSNSLPIHAIGFGWCWDMNWHNDVGGGSNAVYGCRWAGSTVGGPDGDLRWGIDDDDLANTGNHVSMKTYLDATVDYITFCQTSGYPTKVFFTTGPIESSPYGEGEPGYQKAVKHDRIRQFVATNDYYLLDYADILCWSSNGVQTTKSWNGHTFQFIANENTKDFNWTETDADLDHIGQNGALRIGKVLWVMLSDMIPNTNNPLSTYYIRQGASGTGGGTNWTDAYTDLPATFVRGNTYYVADGTYGTHTFNTAIDGTNLIVIKKAIITDHGTETGWNNAYGDGQAVFTGVTTDGDVWRVTTSNWLFDGGFEYGILLNQTNLLDPCRCLRLYAAGGVITNFIINNIELKQCGYSSANNSLTCLYAVETGAGEIRDISVTHCWLHNANQNLAYWYGVKNILMEHNFFSERYNQDSYAVHGQAMEIYGPSTAMNLVVRYCTFRNIEGTGVIGLMDRTDHALYGGCKFYGNVFYCDADHTSDGWTGGDEPTVSDFDWTNGPIFASGDDNVDKQTNIWIYNNTIVDCYGSMAIGLNYGSTNVYVWNNLWCANENNGSIHTATTQGSNSVSGVSTSIFVNYAAHNYHLSSATLPGVSLDAEYAMDSDGYTRGSDGIWDRGAYEFEYVAPALPTMNVNGNVNVGRIVGP